MAAAEDGAKLLEQTLDRIIKEMFLKNKMGSADWDFSKSLREAFMDKKQNIKDLINQYDSIYETAKKSNLVLNSKYNILYKLNS